ncbi:dihydropteroate synthase [Lacticaseibacillus rhamnosus MTCC 5462]|nr:dihydropteroate synthase [Lacticaseibacillus rhamnosus MTCC 5462]
MEADLAAGTAIFEVGGKSSKPHFDDISAEEEWGRIKPFWTLFTSVFQILFWQLIPIQTRLLKKH